MIPRRNRFTMTDVHMNQKPPGGGGRNKYDEAEGGGAKKYGRETGYRKPMEG